MKLSRTLNANKETKATGERQNLRRAGGGGGIRTHGAPFGGTLA